MRRSPGEGLRLTFTHLAIALLTNLLPRLLKWKNQGTQLLNTMNTSTKECSFFLLILEHCTHLMSPYDWNRKHLIVLVQELIIPSLLGSDPNPN